VAQGSHKGDRLPCSKRNGADHPVALGARPLTRAKFVLTASLVDKYQTGWNQAYLAIGSNSASAPHPLAAVRQLAGFFKGDRVRSKKRQSELRLVRIRSLAQLYDGFYQSQVRLLAIRSSICSANSSSGETLPHAASRSALAFVPALQPLYRRTHAHLETVSRLAPRRTAFNSFDYTFSQITRIGLRHRPPPQREYQCTKIRSSLTLWNPPIQIRGNRFRLGAHMLCHRLPKNRPLLLFKGAHVVVESLRSHPTFLQGHRHLALS